MGERIVCPRQAEGTMEVQRRWKPEWRSGRREWSKWRWFKERVLITGWFKFLDRLGIKHRGGFYGGTLWPGGPRPRTCSYCGGVHPEDAIELLKAGWTVEATSKAYKRYLEPPGYREQMRDWKPGGPPSENWIESPVPPVKLYVYHLNQEQIDRFNDVKRRLGA